ncbi:MAG: transposase [Steroidobacteraceae bacterium]
MFFTPEDRALLNSIAADIVPRFGARLHAYCWMTNHIHMLMQVGDTPLGRIILRIASQYARTLQARFHTTGHLFERRYHAVLVDADAYLLELLRYIHLNPVRAAMVPTATDYPWSSHHAYLGTRPDVWVTTEFALSLFHTELPLAIQSYERFMHEAATTGSPLDHCNPSDHRILGSDDFAAKLLGTAWHPRSHKTLEQLLDEACQQWAVSRDALCSPSRHRQLTHARAWIAHQAVTQSIANLSRVARMLNRSEASLRESVKRHFNYP